MQHVANALTLGRVLLSVPLFFFTVFSSVSPACHLAALAVFSLIMASDALDGTVARRWGTVSNFGKEIDPYADKLVDAAIYLALIEVHRVWALTVLTFIIIFRHFTVTVLRGFAARFQTVIAARFTGKTRTVVSFTLAFLLLAQVRYQHDRPYWFSEHLQAVPGWLWDSGIIILMMLTLISLADYIWQYTPLIKRFARSPND